MKKTLFLFMSMFFFASTWSASVRAGDSSLTHPLSVNNSSVELLIQLEKRLPKAWSDRVRIFEARLVMQDVQQVGGGRVYQRTFQGLPSALSESLKGNTQYTASPLFSILNQKSPKVCAIIRVPQNDTQFPFKTQQQALFKAYGADPLPWLIIHEMGHCVQAFLEEAGELQKQEDKPSVNREAFADLFALEWMRRNKDQKFNDYLKALIQQREHAGSIHADAPWLLQYQKSLSMNYVSDELSGCQVAYLFSRPAGFAKAGRLSC